MWLRRPGVEVSLSPRAGRPGAPLEVGIRLTTEAELRIGGIEFVLEGIERVPLMLGAGPEGLVARHVKLRAELPAQTVPEGEWRESVCFDLPTNAPASYAGKALIQYTLSVHVKIPWAPDRKLTFVVPVEHVPERRVSAEPRSFSSDPGGSDGAALRIEAALADVAVVPGDSLLGTIALVGLGRRQPKRVRLDLLAFEMLSPSSRRHLRWPVLAAVRRVERRTFELPVDRFVEGVSVEFVAQLSRHLPPSFRGRFVELCWFAEIVVELRGKRDPRLRIPIRVLPAIERGATVARERAVLGPIGRARRGQVWSAVAQRFALGNDPDSEQLVIALETVSLAVTLEQRGGHGHLVATLRWRALGLDLSVERRYDRLSGWFDGDEVQLPDGGSSQLRVRGREAAQVQRLLEDSALVKTLAGFDEVELGDEGGVVRTRGDGSELEPFAAFIARARTVAERLDRAIRERLTPPAELAPFADAWRAFAARHGAALELGRLRVHGGTLRGRRFEVATRFAGARVDGALLRVVLDRSIEPTDLDVPPDLRALADELRQQCTDLRIGPEHIEATLAGALADPAATEPLLESMVQLSLAIGRRRGGGAYRSA